jgi:hypothetical protein
MSVVLLGKEGLSEGVTGRVCSSEKVDLRSPTNCFRWRPHAANHVIGNAYRFNLELSMYFV